MKPIIGQRETSGTHGWTRRETPMPRESKTAAASSPLATAEPARAESSNAQRVPHPSLGSQYWSTHTLRYAHSGAAIRALHTTLVEQGNGIHDDVSQHRRNTVYGNTRRSRFVLFPTCLHTSRVCASTIYDFVKRTNLSIAFCTSSSRAWRRGGVISRDILLRLIPLRFISLPPP